MPENGCWTWLRMGPRTTLSSITTRRGLSSATCPLCSATYAGRVYASRSTFVLWKISGGAVPLVVTRIHIPVHQGASTMIRI